MPWSPIYSVAIYEMSSPGFVKQFRWRATGYLERKPQRRDVVAWMIVRVGEVCTVWRRCSGWPPRMTVGPRSALRPEVHSRWEGRCDFEGFVQVPVTREFVPTGIRCRWSGSTKRTANRKIGGGDDRARARESSPP